MSTGTASGRVGLGNNDYSHDDHFKVFAGFPLSAGLKPLFAHFPYSEFLSSAPVFPPIPPSPLHTEQQPFKKSFFATWDEDGGEGSEPAGGQELYL